MPSNNRRNSKESRAILDGDRDTFSDLDSSPSIPSHERRRSSVLSSPKTSKSKKTRSSLVGAPTITSLSSTVLSEKLLVNSNHERTMMNGGGPKEIVDKANSTVKNDLNLDQCNASGNISSSQNV